MGESLAQLRFSFNSSVRVESRPTRQTADPGALLLREALDKLGTVDWLASRLPDPRRQDLITHPLPELLRTAMLLFAQGWRDQDDADLLREDPALRLSVSNRRGISPLYPGPGRAQGASPRNPPVPTGLASQPTLSRLLDLLAPPERRQILRRALIRAAARRLRSVRRGHRPRYLTVDIDSLPITVHGHQPGAKYNGHYRERIYHPLIASVAETGDLIDGMLREGNVHTAADSEAFILALLDEVEGELCQVASVRLDAGFPRESLLAALEQRGTGYTARVRNNAVLNRLAARRLKRPAGRPPREPRTWLHDLEYQAESWSRPRRLVLVVQERPGELYLHHFWLVTNWSVEQMSAADVLALYRQRGTAEARMGELMNVLTPALSSSSRPKSRYAGATPQRRYRSCDAFAHNEVLLLLHMLAYELCHALRDLLARATRTGWSLRRLRERVLKVAGLMLVRGRRVTMVISDAAGRLWSHLMNQLARLPAPEP